MILQQLFTKYALVENYQLLRLLQNVEGGRTDVADLLFLLVFLGKLSGNTPQDVAKWIGTEEVPPDLTLPYEDVITDWKADAWDVALEALGS